MTASLPFFVVPGRFEGPLDLLWELVSSERIDVADLPVAQITAQYLAYMERAARLDVDLGIEFAEMAARLILAKSEALLPPDPALENEPETARQSLIRDLLDRARMKAASGALRERLAAHGGAFSRGESLGEGEKPDPDDGDPVTLFEVVRLFERFQEEAALRRQHEMRIGSAVDMEEVTAWLRLRLESGRRLNGTDLLVRELDVQRRGALFLAMLELARSRDLSIQQEDAFDPVYLEGRTAL